jgi:predicted HAD superfamily Cof-like phosphohydrolase
MKASTEHQERIDQFMTCVAAHSGRQLDPVPFEPDQETLKKRLIFLLDEYLEAVEAAGLELCYVDRFRVGGEIRVSGAKTADFFFRPRGKLNLPEFAKELADVSVVTIGTLTTCGIGDRPILEAVDHNNLLKFDRPGGWYNAQLGKWIKPKDHPKPDIAAVLRDQGWPEVSTTEGRPHGESNVP